MVVGSCLDPPPAFTSSGLFVELLGSKQAPSTIIMHLKQIALLSKGLPLTKEGHYLGDQPAVRSTTTTIDV